MTGDVKTRDAKTRGTRNAPGTAARDSWPVLTVGAGPLGMTAAVGLSCFGSPGRLVDRPPEPSTALGAPASKMLRGGNRLSFGILFTKEIRHV